MPGRKPQSVWIRDQLSWVFALWFAACLYSLGWWSWTRGIPRVREHWQTEVEPGIARGVEDFKRDWFGWWPF
jgi:hypothetical protein